MLGLLHRTEHVGPDVAVHHLGAERGIVEDLELITGALTTEPA